MGGFFAAPPPPPPQTPTATPEEAASNKEARAQFIKDLIRQRRRAPHGVFNGEPGA